MGELYWVIFSLAVTLILIVAVKKGWLADAFVTEARKVMKEYLEGATISVYTPAGALFNQLVKYAESAFHAAEQLMHVGAIKPEDRKETAMVMVNRFAEVDGVTLDSGAAATVDQLLEAQCDKAGHKDE